MSDLAYQYMIQSQPQGPEDEYELALEAVAEQLSDVIVAIAGPDAEWHPGPPYQGIDPSKTYEVSGELLTKLAAVREEINSILTFGGSDGDR